MLARLVERADVLMENFRTGVLDRLGFPVSRLHELNPGLVILSITGFGHDGPEASRSGYDQIAQGEGGLMSFTGTEQPTKVGVPIADLCAGMYGAFGVLAALHERSTDRPGPRRAHLPAGRDGRRARLPGDPLDRGRRGARPRGRPPPRDRAVRHVRDGYRADPDRLRIGGPLAGPVHGARTSTPPIRGSPPTRTGSSTVTS